MKKGRLLVGVALMLLVVLVLPSAALGYQWTHTGGSPLIVGGVHSKAKFKSLLLHSSKERNAIKGVLKRDGYPSWVFDAAVAQAAAGNIHTNSLAPGTKIHTMAYGPKKTKYALNTVWNGTGRLPYFYVNVSRTIIQGGLQVTTTFKVALGQICANPFVFSRHVKTTQVSPPLGNFNLYIEKRQDSLEGTRLAGWEVTGTVGDTSVDTTTSDSGPVLVGVFAAGTPYDLSEILQQGWEIVSPAGGNFTGTMPAADLTLTFVNRVTPPVLHNLYVEKRQDSLEGTRLAGWEITGTVGAQSVDTTTSDSGPTLVGQFVAGTPIDLGEILQSGWMFVSPTEGSFETTMPDGDLTLTFVNSQVSSDTCEFLTKGFWHNQNGLAILNQHPDWITYVNTLAPYSGSPFTSLSQISNYLVAPDGGDPKVQLQEQLLAFIFNVKSCGATSIFVNGNWVTTDSIISDAIAAWNTGGQTAVDMSSKLDALNNDVLQSVQH